MTVHVMPQRSPEWYAIRRGKFTASDFPTLMPSSRQKETDWNDTQMKIIYRVASERMTNEDQPKGYTSTAMQWGIDTEDEARAAYEMETGNAVDQVGFVELTEWIGCSPDGLIRDDGYLEIKCPNSDTHLRYANNPHALEEDYGWQVIGGLWVSGREWAHLISYDPRFIDPEDQMVIYTISDYNEAAERLANRIDLAIAKAKEIINA